VVFGSCASGAAGPWSDIDVVVVSPAFDGVYPRELVSRLWRTDARTDSRIEPIPCGERQWREEQASPILEIARQHGVAVGFEGVVGEGGAQT
jgi:predicted nucleotidyltransferase